MKHIEYGPSNPHPGFNRDPNVINEYGHTKYPKAIYPFGTGPVSKSDQPPPIMEVANSEEEEKEILAKYEVSKDEANAGPTEAEKDLGKSHKGDMTADGKPNPNSASAPNPADWGNNK